MGVDGLSVGFVGLGEVGGKLAGSLAREGFDLTVFDLSPDAVARLAEKGAKPATSVADIAAGVDVLITCLPSPAASAAVIDEAFAAMRPGSLWLEMSTTDADEVRRLEAIAAGRGIAVLDCPVSGGCHRAATGNIAIFAGGDRAAFERALPLLTAMGADILHTGPLGSASTLKVMTNYLATANLVTLCEALMVMEKSGQDLATTFEAIRISSGNSFVHETESQLILNGSRNVGFTMDLVLKDIGLFQKLADAAGIGLEVNPLLIDIFRDGKARYGGGEWSTNIVRRIEDATGTTLHADGFPEELVDTVPKQPGHEIPARPAQSKETVS